MPERDRSDEEISFFRGRVESFMETHGQRVDVLFESLHSVKEKIDLVRDEGDKSLDAKCRELEIKVHEAATRLSNLSARLAVVAALFSFLGTVVTSLFVAVIIKVFLK